MKTAAISRAEFKEKYLSNNFFWVSSEEQADKIQSIMLEFGLRCHTGDKSKIKWHEGFKNIVAFPRDKFHDFEYFQKVDVCLRNASYGEPVNYEAFLSDYNSLNNG
jgi:hypothetical protein